MHLNEISYKVLLGFSGFYLTGVLSVSPIYYAFILSLFGFFILASQQQRIYIQHSLLLYLLISTVVFVLHLPRISGAYSALIGFYFSILYMFLFYIFLRSAKPDISNLLDTAKKVIYWMVMPLALVETFYRLRYPLLQDFYGALGDGSLWFYPYKLNSIMYMDSNFTGIFLVVTLGFLLWLKSIGHRISIFGVAIIFLLVVLTFSRASTITAIVLLFFYSNRKWIFRHKIKTSILLITLGILVFLTLSKISVDDSLSSKFYILGFVDEFFALALPKIIFGIGFGNFVEFAGIGAHNILMVYLVEGGVLIFVATLLFFYQALRNTRYRAIYIILPLLVNGMSLGHATMPYFYVYLIVIHYYYYRSAPSVKLNA